MSFHDFLKVVWLGEEKGQRAKALWVLLSVLDVRTDLEICLTEVPALVEFRLSSGNDFSANK